MRSSKDSSSSSSSSSTSNLLLLGLGLGAAGVVSMMMRRPVKPSQVGSFTSLGTRGVQWGFGVKNKYLGMPVKMVKSGERGAKSIEGTLDRLSNAHDVGHTFGFKSTETSLHEAFESFRAVPQKVCQEVEDSLEASEAPILSHYEEGSGLHKYLVAMALPLDETLLQKALSLSHEDILTTSASHFPGGFDISDRGTGKMPKGIVLAGGDRVDIKGYIPISGGIREGGFHEFITRYHSLHGVLIHSSWINLRKRKLYVARFGVGEAPKLQGSGMGMLDVVNVQEGPHVWAAADFKMVRELFGQEAFEVMWAAASEASGRDSRFGFDTSYKATGVVANLGGKVARPTKHYILPLLRELQDLLRAVED